MNLDSAPKCLCGPGLKTHTQEICLLSKSYTQILIPTWAIRHPDSENSYALEKGRNQFWELKKGEGEQNANEYPNLRHLQAPSISQVHLQGHSGPAASSPYHSLGHWPCYGGHQCQTEFCQPGSKCYFMIIDIWTQCPQKNAVFFFFYEMSLQTDGSANA